MDEMKNYLTEDGDPEMERLAEQAKALETAEVNAQIARAEREAELKERGIRITDDAMVVETLLNHSVKMVEGSYENIKITTPEDLEIARSFLKK